MSTVASIAYVPPKGKLHSESFMSNLAKFPAKLPLYIISDDAGWTPSRTIHSPEYIYPGMKKRWTVNNYVFLSCLQMAIELKTDYFFLLEADSRVGCAGWDERVFDEFNSRYPQGIDCAGSPVCHDISSGGRGASMRVIELAAEYQKACGLPVALYGSKHPSDTSGLTFYPNGSLAIYKTEAIARLFAGFEGSLANVAAVIMPWDMEIGRRLWHNNGPDAVDHVGFLTRTYSGYGDAVVDYPTRKQMLVSGARIAIHQVKDDWIGP